MAEGSEKNISSNISDDPELDELLDEAFKECTAPINSENFRPPGGTWSEEFIQEATKNFEKTLRSMMEHQTLAAQNIEDPSMKNIEETVPPEVSKFIQAAAEAAAVTQQPDVSKCLSETMKQMSETAADLQAPPNIENLTKMFENVDIGGMGDMAAMMQTMLKNIISKDVIYSPIKEIVDKYPDWLADHRESLSEEVFVQYSKQFDIMKKVMQLYDEEKENDSEDVKDQRFEKVVSLMQELQELGLPPEDLVGDMGSILNFDSSGKPIMPDVDSLLEAAGCSSADGNKTQCTVM